MLIAVAEQGQLTECFRAVSGFLQATHAHWSLGASYEGWVRAQHREASQLIPAIVRRLQKQVQASQASQAPGESRWNVFAVDGTHLTCPRTTENQGAMGDSGKPGGMPLISLTMILHLATRLPWDFRVGPGVESERAHLRQMIDDLPGNSLLVADAGFTGYDLFALLIEKKRHFLLRVGRNVRLLDRLGYATEVKGRTVYLWPDQQRKRDEPPIVLRLIIVRDENKQPVYLVTDVLDPNELSDEEAAEIYRQRWGIEVSFRTLKQTMDHCVLRSRTPENCYMEATWAVLGQWLLELMTAREVAASGADPCKRSPAQARNCVRRAMRNQAPCHRSPRKGLSSALAQCQIDSYARKGPKASRNYPRKKTQKPPRPPIIKPPNEAQLQQAQQLTPIKILV
jgi:hypothetical protein